jgi:hypothetical protein
MGIGVGGINGGIGVIQQDINEPSTMMQQPIRRPFNDPIGA